MDALGRVIGDAGDQGAEIRLGVEAVEFGSLDDGVHGGGAVAAAVGTDEGPVPAAERQGPYGAFGGVVADVEASVSRVARQCVPA